MYIPGEWDLSLVHIELAVKTVIVVWEKNTIITNWRWKVVKYSTVDGLSQYRPQYNNHTGCAWS